MARRKIPLEFGIEFVAYAPLTMLLNSGGGIHPIVVGSIWRHLISKFATKEVGKYMTNISMTFNLVLEFQVVYMSFCILPT